MGLGDIYIPEDELPGIAELPEDLQVMALEIERALEPDVGAERAAILGVSLAIRSGQAFNGTMIRVGGIKAILRKYRDKLIRKACDEGETTLALARKFCLDPRTITKINARVDEEPPVRQRGLFD